MSRRVIDPQKMRRAATVPLAWLAMGLVMAGMWVEQWIGWLCKDDPDEFTFNDN